ncbi:hypothetical protein [Planctomonas psychrotolerans]|uniref:hypothetical protein n=1 Tax=Planctomonas psychrotolerans TaxID=2528712 RepID=UPI00123A20B0|nr:hypothetical protein [Planctomonas psychrotolerans]
MIHSDAFGPLTAELRRAEAEHHNVNRLFPALVRARGMDGADDAAAVLLSRLGKATARESSRGFGHKAPRLIVGLIPEALGPTTPEMRRALDERRTLIEQRARHLTERALTRHEAWTEGLGTEPEGTAGAVWRRQIRIVAAHRDRYGITGPRPLGTAPASSAEERDAAGTDSDQECPTSRARLA